MFDANAFAEWAAKFPGLAKWLIVASMAVIAFLFTALLAVIAFAARRIYGDLIDASAKLRRECEALRGEGQKRGERLTILEAEAIKQPACHAAHDAVIARMDKMETHLSGQIGETHDRITEHLRDHATGALT